MSHWSFALQLLQLHAEIQPLRKPPLLPRRFRKQQLPNLPMRHSLKLDAVGDIEVEKELFDVTVTVPADYVGDATQEELSKEAEANGYKIVLNDDGSATYTMSKSQHKKMMDEAF